MATVRSEYDQDVTAHKDADYYRRGEYTKKCKWCDHVNTIISHWCEDPEYDTTIYTYCYKCREELEWSIAVN